MTDFPAANLKFQEARRLMIGINDHLGAIQKACQVLGNNQLANTIKNLRKQLHDGSGLYDEAYTIALSLFVQASEQSSTNMVRARPTQPTDE